MCLQWKTSEESLKFKILFFYTLEIVLYWDWFDNLQKALKDINWCLSFVYSTELFARPYRYNKVAAVRIAFSLNIIVISGFAV